MSTKSVRCYDNLTSAPVVYNECISSGEDNPWCYTRTFPNNSHILGQYGDCGPGCGGLNTSLGTGAWNLAGEQHGEMWGEGVYRLDEESSGHCHTFNPANISYSGYRGQFYALLGLDSEKIFCSNY